MARESIVLAARQRGRKYDAWDFASPELTSARAVLVAAYISRPFLESGMRNEFCQYFFSALSPGVVCSYELLMYQLILYSTPCCLDMDQIALELELHNAAMALEMDLDMDWDMDMDLEMAMAMMEEDDDNDFEGIHHIHMLRRPNPPVNLAPPPPHPRLVAIRNRLMLRRRLHFRMRGGDHPQPNDVEHPPNQLLVNQLEQQHPLAAQAVADALAVGVLIPSQSPVLFNLVREDVPCCAVLSGRNVRGCRTVVERCHEHSFEVNYCCPRTGRTPLHEAAYRCACPHIIQAMMIHHEPHARALHLDARLNTPLHLLFLGIANRRLETQDSEQIVQLLLQPLGIPGTIRNRDGCLPLHCACAAPEAMVPAGAVEQLLAATPSAASRTNYDEQTPLHLHCQRRNASVQVAQLLLEAYPLALRLGDRTDWGCSPLHYAAKRSNHALMQLLVARDAAAATTRTLRADKTPLHILCETSPSSANDVSSIRILLKVAPETALWAEHATLFTPLHLLCRSIHPSMSSSSSSSASSQQLLLSVVQSLVEAGPAALGRLDVNDRVPLHYACENGADPRIIQCLLQAHPAAATLRTRQQDTALSLACIACHPAGRETVQLVLRHYPDAARLPNKYGYLPLHVLCRRISSNNSNYFCHPPPPSRGGAGGGAPSTAICQALLEAYPEAVWKRTRAGESALDLLLAVAGGSNNGNSATNMGGGVWDLLQRTMQSLPAGANSIVDGNHQRLPTAAPVGNTSTNTPCMYCYKSVCIFTTFSHSRSHTRL
jgi:ankyrin repeat protein